ncbi:exosome complex component RRP43 isoform X2 [Hydra vulgaris]|uniref:Ribosomal RNA-processing protein 43 n=1 Tax=Hydra vulgaris TaxID=6087 RepID=A0ABM4D6Y9_HYDVU
MAQDFKIARPLEYYKEFLKENIRPDGRALHEYRKTIININSIKTASGSGLVRIGNTIVVCGIKAELAEPSVEKTNEGYFVPNVDLPALCSHEFRPGPPSDQAQAMSQFIAETVENCKLINLKKLCIKEKKLCWVIYADIICISHDGNLIDAIIASLYIALLNTKLPVVTINEETGSPEASPTEQFTLELSTRLSSTTVELIDNKLLVDPTYEEEQLSLSSLTIILGDEKNIISIYKPGGCSVNEDSVRTCIKYAIHRAEELDSLIHEASECNDRSI